MKVFILFRQFAFCNLPARQAIRSSRKLRLSKIASFGARTQLSLLITFAKNASRDARERVFTTHRSEHACACTHACTFRQFCIRAQCRGISNGGREDEVETSLIWTRAQLRDTPPRRKRVICAKFPILIIFALLGRVYTSRSALNTLTMHW